jgi:hypothetical protein
MKHRKHRITVKKLRKDGHTCYRVKGGGKVKYFRSKSPALRLARSRIRKRHKK